MESVTPEGRRQSSSRSRRKAAGPNPDSSTQRLPNREFFILSHVCLFWCDRRKNETDQL